MTPFELSLSYELDIERQRFDSEWLFQWHNISSERHIVDVPDFRGGRITIGGVRFEGSAPLVYWNALGRYVNGKVHETFQRWDRETLPYPAALRRSSLHGTEMVLRRFVAAVMERANSTDQALRGRGTPKTDKAMEGSAAHSHANVEILRLKHAHEALLPAAVPAKVEEEVEQSRWAKVWGAVNLRPGFMGMNIDLKALLSRKRK
jgi:hypothetical protein